MADIHQHIIRLQSKMELVRNLGEKEQKVKDRLSVKQQEQAKVQAEVAKLQDELAEAHQQREEGEAQLKKLNEMFKTLDSTS